MVAHKTTGFVIERWDFSETSQVVCFYTRDFGKLRVLAKGSKRPKSAFEGPLDLLSGGTLLFLEKRAESLGLLTAFHQTEGFLGVRRSLDRFHQALWICELLARLTREADPNEELFRLAWEALERIAADGGGPLGRAAFECRLTQALGFALRVDRCLTCDRELAPAAPPTPWWFSPRLGGPLCESCAPAEPERLRASAGAFALVGNLSYGRTSRVDRLRVAEPTAGELRRILSAYLTHLLGRPPRMLRFLE